MDDLEKFKQMAETARSEESPRTDVSSAVMARIGSEHRIIPAPVDRLLLYVTGAAAAVALVSAIIGMKAFSSFDAPWMSWLNTYDFLGIL
jgi:hypothetical protein